MTVSVAGGISDSGGEEVVVVSEGGRVVSAGRVEASGGDARTVTTRETLPVFPAASVAEYVSVYKAGDWKLETGSWTSGVTVTTIFAVRSPSTSSAAVAPGSVNASPTMICKAASPMSVTTGGVTSLWRLEAGDWIVGEVRLPDSGVDVKVDVLSSTMTGGIALAGLLFIGCWLSGVDVAICPSVCTRK